MVYEDIYDAKTACEKLSGFNVHNRCVLLASHRRCRQRLRVIILACSDATLFGDFAPENGSPTGWTAS